MPQLAPAEWSLPEKIRNQLGDEEGNMRALSTKQDLVIVLAAVPQKGDTEREPLLFWWDIDEDTWLCSDPEHDEHPLRLIRSYEAALEALEMRLERAESADDVYAILDELVPFTRAGRGLNRAFVEARNDFPDIRLFVLMRDRAAGIERLADHLLKDARHNLSFIAAKHAEEQADAAQKLNRIVLFFLPLTALSGVFGMNLTNTFETTPYAFLVVLGAAILIGFALVLTLGRDPNTSPTKPNDQSSEN